MKTKKQTVYTVPRILILSVTQEDILTLSNGEKGEALEIDWGNFDEPISE